jgi:type I restriction enzyme S subunit
MKDSGADWLGRIPAHWSLLPLRRGIEFLTDFEANGSFSDLKEKVVLDIGEPFAWYVRATDLENGRIGIMDSNRYCDKETYNFLDKTKLLGGELLVAKRGEIGKVYVLPYIDCPATLAPNLYLIRLNEKLFPLFAYYWFESIYGKRQLILLNFSTTIGALYKDDIKNCPCIFPTYEEQIAIANFLDRNIARMDYVKEKVTNTISKLQNYRTTLVSEAVSGKIDIRQNQED